jgi:hypothetical protein
MSHLRKLSYLLLDSRSSNVSNLTFGAAGLGDLGLGILEPVPHGMSLSLRQLHVKKSWYCYLVDFRGQFMLR